jgi:ATP-dependent helicase/nuclease subunit A
MSDATRAQVRAATPDRSSWVSANAGSGKTRVLTDRVARLLLAGTDPQKILCLTYTKAAAAEMQNRLFKTLGGWAMLEDDDLRAALTTLGATGGTIPDADLARARTLFARALETPGGLKIQTIHSFCDALLRRFPLEAGVTPQFSVLEDRQARALREEVLDALALSEPAIFTEMARYFTGQEPDGLFQEINRHAPAFSYPFDQEALAAALGVNAGLSMDDVHDAVITTEALHLLNALVPILEMSGPNDQKAAAKITRALASDDPGIRLEGLEAVFLYGGGAKMPFGAKAGVFPTKAVRNAHFETAEALDLLMVEFEAVRQKRTGIAAFEKSVALNRFARVWLTAWGARKQALGLLEFDDLIARTGRLLSQPETAAWVLWRLDGGIDHILVDEAQDTSPAQWQVIDAISGEFFAGLGARELTRTIFVVGDPKQSIYSFQGAEPAAFARMGDHYRAILDGRKDSLQRCDLLYSFRSAEPVLRLVDTVFDRPGMAGLTGAASHIANAPDMPGRVELWPFLPKPEKAEEGPWHEPAGSIPLADPVRELAGMIAKRIKGWLDEGRMLPRIDEDRIIRGGNILILVQRRGGIFHAIIRALKQTGVPVAGADVLRIGGELAVRDLLAALRVAATPRDDLSLAALLRSPLCGLSETDLFGLAHSRPGSLNAALRARPDDWPNVQSMLADMQARADYLRPFEMLERLLIRHDGRSRLMARLGPEAEDGIDALLDQTLAYESVEAPSLTGFLAWFDRDEVKIKRRMDDSADQVRVMTVHGAKGLESPIVILPDTAQLQEGRHPPQVLRLQNGVAAWKTSADSSPQAIIGAERARRDLVREENQRLLYVALTRAESWLIACGAGVAPKPDGGSWHEQIKAALEQIGARAEPGPRGDTLALEHNWNDTSAGPQTPPGDRAAALPDWANRAFRAAKPGLARTLTPSDLGGGHAIFSDDSASDGEAEALERGDAVHRLLEILPGIPESRWPDMAKRLCPDILDLAGILDEVTRVLKSPELARVFATGTLAEVDVSASLPELKGARISGRIDRLIIGMDRILAVDFKSNRIVPNRPEAVPEGILRQLGAYHSALSAIWPDRRVDMAVLWTGSAELMEMPREIIQNALARAADLDPPDAAS